MEDIMNIQEAKLTKKVNPERKQAVSRVYSRATKSLGNIIIKPIDRALARELIVKHHYSHKWNDASFGKFNFGIFKAEMPDECLGVAVYGHTKNPRAKLFEHPNENAWMCELNRMWISDELGHNAESLFIGATLKMVKEADPNIVAVQSFADGRLGCGTIYKAANFRYFGCHNTLFLENKRTGVVEHEQNFTNSVHAKMFLRCNIGLLCGDYVTWKVKTYRYIYPFCKHFVFRKPQKPYPLYEKGKELVEWKYDRQSIKDKVVKLLEVI